MNGAAPDRFSADVKYCLVLKPTVPHMYITLAVWEGFHTRANSQPQETTVMIMLINVILTCVKAN